MSLRRKPQTAVDRVDDASDVSVPRISHFTYRQIQSGSSCRGQRGPQCAPGQSINPSHQKPRSFSPSYSRAGSSLTNSWQTPPHSVSARLSSRLRLPVPSRPASFLQAHCLLRPCLMRRAICHGLPPFSPSPGTQYRHTHTSCSQSASSFIANETETKQACEPNSKMIDFIEKTKEELET